MECWGLVLIDSTLRTCSSRVSLPIRHSFTLHSFISHNVSSSNASNEIRSSEEDRKMVTILLQGTAISSGTKGSCSRDMYPTRGSTVIEDMQSRKSHNTPRSLSCR